MPEKPEVTFFVSEGKDEVHDLDIGHPPETADDQFAFQHIPTDLEEK